MDTTNRGYFGYGSETVMRVVYGKTGGSPQLAFGTSSAADNIGAFSETVRINNAGNVGIGVVNPQSKLAVNGAISAKEVIVTMTPADYVFSPDYRLTRLRDVAEFVKAHHHLPEIPAATEVEEKGVSAGQMQAKLPAKIEEVTLHLIEAEERSAELANRVAAMEEGRTNNK